VRGEVGVGGFTGERVVRGKARVPCRGLVGLAVLGGGKGVPSRGRLKSKPENKFASMQLKRSMDAALFAGTAQGCSVPSR
jgi:hypothetical protein